MLRLTKDLGVRIEMMTNGTRLDEAMINGQMEAGIDRLWISLDAVPECGGCLWAQGIIQCP